MKMTISSIAKELILLLAYLPSLNCQYWSPGCKSWPNGVPAEHLDESCDRAHQFYGSDWKANLDEPEIVLKLPEDKTILCPVEDILTHEDLPYTGGHQVSRVNLVGR